MRTKKCIAVPTFAVVSLSLAFIASTVAYSQVPAGPNRPAGVPEGYVITPFGYFHPSCVRRLADGETLQANGHLLQHANGTLENIPACGYPHYTARGEMVAAGARGGEPPTISHSWIEDADTTTSTSYGEITATWIVPPGPTFNDGQTVYFFPGLEDYVNDVSIIQPVLGWNADYSAAWGIASWNCCVNGTTWESSPVSVSSGDTIQGTVGSTCSAGTLTCPTWNITTTDVSSSKSTTLGNSPNEGQTFDWAFAGALEVYNILRCGDYPSNGSITFSDVALYDNNFVLISNPGWSIENYSSGLTPQCSYGGQVAATEVTLNYGVTTLTVSPATLSFGSEAMDITSAARKVTLTNSTSSVVTISSAVIGGKNPGDFVQSATTCGQTLGLNKSCTISLTFTPSALGARSATLTITDSASNSPQTVAISGTGVGQAALTPASITFAKQRVNTTSAPRNVTLKNNLPTTLTGISFSAEAPFAVSASTCTSTLASKKTCTISVTFTPTVTGKVTGLLSVSDSANNSPQTVSLTGTGD